MGTFRVRRIARFLGGKHHSPHNFPTSGSNYPSVIPKSWGPPTPLFYPLWTRGKSPLGIIGLDRVAHYFNTPQGEICHYHSVNPKSSKPLMARRITSHPISLGAERITSPHGISTSTYPWLHPFILAMASSIHLSHGFIHTSEPWLHPYVCAMASSICLSRGIVHMS